MKEFKMWIVETNTGIAYIGRDPNKDPKADKKAEKGEFSYWEIKSLGYPVIFKNKKDAQKFARIAKKSNCVDRAYVFEVEFYKGELEG